MSQIAYLGGVLVIFCFLVLVDYLVDTRLPSRERLWCYLIPTGILGVLGFSSIAIQGVVFPVGIPAEIVPGPLYSMTLVLCIGTLIYGLIRLFQGYTREQRYTRRMQLLYVLTGLILTTVGEIIFDGILPVFGELRFFSLGPITSVFFVIGCAYAITRHKLLDLRIIIQRGAIYTIFLATIIVSYLVVVNTIGLLIDERSTSILLGAGITTVFGIFSAPILEHAFRKATDRFFFKDWYNYAEVLHELSEILYTDIELADIVRDTEHALATRLRTNSARIILSGEPYEDISTALSVPILLEGKEVALILLGLKRSDEPYTKEDRQLLSTFAYQAATALSRAQLYEEARHYAADLARKVEERTEELRVAQESQRRMLVDISHNLQTPLAVFQTRLEKLKGMFPGDPEILNFEQSLASLSNFIYDLLSLATLDQAETETKETIFLTRVLEEIVEEVTVIAGAHNIQVLSDLAPELRLYGNEKRLREAIMNILNNAIKYMGSGNRREIGISLSADAENAYMRITDTGIGIPSKEIPQICKRFYRSTNGRDAVSGTGLGLAIVQRIVEAHKGSIQVESALGKGTTFTILFPLTNESNPATPNP